MFYYGMKDSIGVLFPEKFGDELTNEALALACTVVSIIFPRNRACN
jgi:hypothetical protein